MSKKSRNWDASTESKADKKFHDLRGKGYKGPIDQDGNKVKNVDQWAAKQRSKK